MLTEILNALCLTYFATEYIIISMQNDNNQHYLNNGHNNNNNNSKSNYDSYYYHHIKSMMIIKNYKKQYGIILFLILIVNIMNQYQQILTDLLYITHFVQKMNHLLNQFYFLPKFIFASSLYIITLYIDIQCYYCYQRQQVQVPLAEDDTLTSTFTIHFFMIKFLPRVGYSFLKMLPIYPFLAVIISFLFLFIITIFEQLHIPVSILNGPIYYGTLYGPLSYMYYDMKQQMIQQHRQQKYYTLPTTTTTNHNTKSTTSTTATITNGVLSYRSTGSVVR